MAISTVGQAASRSVRSGFASTHRELRKAVKGTCREMSMSTRSMSTPEPPGPPQASSVRHTPPAAVPDTMPSPTMSNQAGRRSANSATISSREGTPGVGEADGVGAGESAGATGEGEAAAVGSAGAADAGAVGAAAREAAGPGAHAPSPASAAVVNRPRTTARRRGGGAGSMGPILPPPARPGARRRARRPGRPAPPGAAGPAPGRVGA